MRLTASIFWIVILICIGAPLPGMAQDRSFEGSEPFGSRIQHADFERIGPFGGSVLAIEADPSGALWAEMYLNRVFRSDDSGQTWFLTSQHNGFADFTRGLDGELYGQLNEWGGPFVESRDGGRTWSRMTVTYTVLETGETADGALFALTVDRRSRTLFATAVAGGVLRSDDGGRTWRAIIEPLSDPYVHSLALHPDGSLFAVASGAVYQTQDRGETWQEVGAETLPDDIRRTAGLFITSRGSLLAASASGALFRSADHGATWRHVAEAQFGSPAVGSIEVGADSSSVCLISYGKGLYCSADDGATWRSVGDGLPAVPLTFTFDAEGSLIAGTHEGVFHTTDFGESWAARNEGLVTLQITDLLAPEAGRVVVGTGRGVYGLSTVEPEWELTNSSAGGALLAQGGDDVLFAATTNAFGNGAVERSSDGGRTWEPVLHLREWDRHWATSVSANANGTVLLTSTAIYKNKDEYGFVHLSTDGGETWSMSSFPLCSASFVDAQGTLYAVCVGDEIRISDGGQWQSSDMLATTAVRWLVQTHDRHLLAGSPDGRDRHGHLRPGSLHLSKDGGRSWIRTAPEFGGVLDAFQGTDGEIIVLSEDGAIARTSDGHTLHVLARVDSSFSRLTAVALDAEGRVLVGTASDGLLRSREPVATVVEEDAESLRRPVALEQNWPNPFSHRTTITFDVPVATVGSLKIHDALGREVATLLEGVIPVGRHEASWDASRCPSGTYVIVLRMGGVQSSRVAVLVR